MEPSPVEAEQPFKHGDTVVTAVAVEVGMESGAHRDTQPPCRRGGGDTKRPLGGDIDCVWAVRCPEPGKPAAAYQAESQIGIAGQWQPGNHMLAGKQGFASAVKLALALMLLAWPYNGYPVTTLHQALA